MKSVTIDGVDYIINNDVADLIIMISKERDSLRDGLINEFTQQARRAGGMDKDVLVVPLNILDPEAKSPEVTKD